MPVLEAHPEIARTQRVTFDIEIKPDGPSDADFDAFAASYARQRVREAVPTSLFRRFLFIFGLNRNHSEPR